MGIQRPVQVDGVGPGGEVQPVDDGLLVGGGGSRREAVRPDFRGGGNKPEVHRHGQVARQGVHKAQAGQKSLLGGNTLLSRGILPGGSVHPVDKGVLGGEIDPLILLLAGQTLTPGLGGYPEVPAHDVVGDVVLGGLHELAVGQVLRRQLRRLLQKAVLQRGEVLVGQEQTDDAHAPDEGAE
ncbi:hypothetical protein N510_001091 [Firmicutes bacterium ASF500]|nr:hypothetical protein N510_001091 [Firmicutes bacterium ASF500]